MNKFSWYLSHEGKQTDMIFDYIRILSDIVLKKNLQVRILQNDCQIIIVKNKKECNGKNILIAGGVHGEEPAGSWAILRYLQNVDPKIFNKINISFLPIVSIDAFSRGTRLNSRGFSSNSPYQEITLNLGDEVKLIKKNILLLKELSKDGFLTLHEDIERDKGYIYYLGDKAARINAAYLLNVIRDSFPIYDKDKLDIYDIKDGIISNIHDDTLEEFLYDYGAESCYTTETPGLNDIDKKVNCNYQIIEKFIEIILRS